jgi:hypothetical protein
MPTPSTTSSASPSRRSDRAAESILGRFTDRYARQTARERPVAARPALAAPLT